ASAAPQVQMMVVGAGNTVLAGPRTVSVGAATVQAGHRRCGALAGTPLAALGDLHSIGGPAFALRDYGRCNGSGSSSGQLYVYSLDGETAHGQQGWEYKVDNRTGVTGSGDPSGPQGDGRRLRSGQQLLWFWCVAFAGGCQRNLALRAPGSVAAGSSFTATVVGYDNDGRGTPMSGALVRLGAARATSSGGRVTLRAPAGRGRYTLGASRNGSVPAFPLTIAVR
ncbi:MAG TPA: hypothetical protein VGD00_05025, partial [Solirubrobacteraceae bacterium]